MEDYYEYLDSNGVTTLYKLIKDDTVALIDSYSVTINGITTTLDTHINDSDIHTPISDIESMVDTKISGLVNSAPETLDTLKELSDALGSDPNFATTVANQIGNKANKDSVYTKEETNALLDGKANSVHNHVVSDITDFPTIPTKLSQLENDMGFGSGSGGVITSISWTNITDKPNFATVATSGSYTDLSNTPTIPTKVSQLENDMGFGTGGDTSDCVHKSGDETIDGNKFFIQDVNVKNSDVDIAVTPSNNLFSCFRFRGKGNVTTASIQYSQRTYGVNDICFYVSDADSNSHGFRIRTDNRLEPIENNTYSLGSSSSKWADVYSTNAHINYTYTNRVTTYSIAHPTDNSYFFVSGGSDYNKGATLYLGGISATNFTPGRFALAARKTDGSSIELAGSPDGTLLWNGKNVAIDENLVHRSGDESISGTKMFSGVIHRYADLTTSGDAQVYRFDDTNANPCGHIYNNVHRQDNAIANGPGAYNAKSGKIMELEIASNDAGVGMVYVAGNTIQGNLETVTSATDYPAIATMGWVNNPATSTNVVHRSGNEYIGGIKSFSSVIYLLDNIINKNNQVDLTVTPTTNLYTHYLFIDKNGKVTAYMQHGNQTSGTDFIGLFVKDKSENLIGVELTTNKAFIPLHNNAYGLGSSTNKWANVYADTFNGNLMGTADTATYSPTPATTDNSTRIATTAWVRTYVNSVAGNHTVVNSVAGSGSRSASISAYYSNATTLTAEGSPSSSDGSYPSDYSDYINISPTVGTIYTGSQLFGTLNASASGSKYSHSPSGQTVYQTTAKATAKFSGAFSSSAKYLCTTANAVKFRAFVSQGTTSDIGTASVVDNSSTKSIFIRVE